MLTNNETSHMDDTEENIPEEIRKLHESVRSGNFNEVKEFTSNFPDQRLCYGNESVCVLEHAIDCRKFEIYSYLRANNFYTDKGNVLEEKISKLSSSQKFKIRIENLKYVKEFPNAFIGILLSKCKFDSLSTVSYKAVQKMLTELSRIPELRPFLEIASQTDLKIIFDFSTESCKNMDPSADEGTMGLAYFNRGELYVGRDVERLSRYGTVMHELSHLLLYLIYENNCLPYCKGDEERERQWEQILEHESSNYEANNENIEPIIKWVFDYYDPGYQQKAELAVRPNHIRARYLNDHEKVQETIEAHQQLFDFFQNFVTPDLQIPNVYRLITLNKNFGVIEKIEESNLQLKVCEDFELVNLNHERLVLTSNVPKLALSKLLHEIKNSVTNKLDVKVKNIFVDVEKLKLVYYENELKNLVETSEVDRVIFDVTEVKNVEKTFEFLEKFKSKVQVVVVCDEENSEKFENFTQTSITFGFESLTEKSQQKLLNKEINFQGIHFKLLNFLSQVSTENFSLLCQKGKISVNVDDVKQIKNFIPRILERGVSEFSLDELLTSSETEQIVVLSDLAGSGKTTSLKKIAENLLKEYPTHWISFVGLRDFIEQLLKISDETFDEAFMKLLNLSQIEREIFKQKFKNGEVKILFDAFDEISPKCKDETLKLFKLFKAQDKNQIFITTRTHLEHDLESELNAKSYHLKILSESDQIKFLCDFWKNSHDDENFIKICAEQLTQKIADIIKNFPKLIGVPIIIQSVAKFYVNKINENFPNEIRNLKIFEVYEKILEECLNILNKNQPTNVTKVLSPLQVHFYMAIVHFFGKNFAKELGLTFNEKEWPLEEISRYGIICHDKFGKIYFNHETYAEHLLAKFIFEIIRRNEQFTYAKKKLVKDLLNDVKFEISRVFLDEMLEKFDDDVTNFKLILDQKYAKLILERKLPNVFKIYCDKFIKNKTSQEVVKFLEETLMKLIDDVSFLRFFEIFKKFLSESNHYFDIFTDFLYLPSHQRSNFFNFFREEKTILENLSESLKPGLKNIENMKGILLQQNHKRETILHHAMSDIDMFQKILSMIANKTNKNELKKIIGMKDINDQSIFMLSLLEENGDYIRSIFVEVFNGSLKHEKIREFLNLINYEKTNILHLALALLPSEWFEFVWFNVCHYVEYTKRIICIKNTLKQNLLMTAIFHKKSFNLILEFIERTMNENEKENYLLDVSNDSKSILHFTLGFKLEDKINCLLEFLTNNLSVETQRKLFQLKNSAGQTALISSFKTENVIYFIKLFEYAEQFMRKPELVEQLESLVSETDNCGCNFLHNAVYCSECLAVFNILWKYHFENASLLSEKDYNFFSQLFDVSKNFKNENFSSVFMHKDKKEILFKFYENISDKNFKASSGTFFRKILIDAILSRDQEILYIALETCIEKLGKENFFNLLCEDDGMIPQILMEHPYEDTFKCFWVKVFETFKNDKSILSALIGLNIEDKHGRKIWHFASSWHNYPLFL